MARKLVNFARSELNIGRIPLCFSPILEPRTRSVIPFPKWEQQVCVMVDKFLQSNKSTGRLGEARQSGNSAVAAELAVLFRCASIFLITAGSSMLAIIRTSPPHSLQPRRRSPQGQKTVPGWWAAFRGHGAFPP